ncbi:MAG TPA: dihydroxyacetone kinase subunit DhaK [Candidatus Stercoripulliclostridium merdipullorum]|uniref:phosphoenolpyruvate--glycerone phosphotransferase n=1 Tax=Candidatus Stercoripulliclostridium merdipullorum TaxID=2840952 RepID=A0A9D1SYJ2_9FIRM|nr:dihydroxyacetone kinase subunit DhaK [Candidatus Stercoripulliclostridium merdipullorum]
MKKIINTPETFVYDMCHGLALAHPELEFVEQYKVVKKKAVNRNKVQLISGGGSGHEPAHAGFVGKGMLDAAVCGDVFASPSQIQVYNAIKQTKSNKGTLLIIKNYSGDCMNFNNAAQLAKEDIDGLQIDAVYVNDDIAVTDSLYTVGRRGVAGTVFVHKIAGAAAEMGKSLEEVKAIAQKTIDNVRSLGFALTSCTVPAKGTPTFDIGDDEMEFGVGIHGEPGRTREKIQSADQLAKRIVKDLIADLKVKKGDEVSLLINGFGGSPLQELYLFNNSVSKELAKAGVKIYRTFVGNYMTSIDMAGASVTILKMDDELKAHIDYPVDAPAFKIYSTEAVQSVAEDLATGSVDAVEHDDAVYEVEGEPVIADVINTAGMVALIDKMADIIIENEVHFCDMDSVAGDGDFGMSIAKGFKQLKKDWKSRKKGNIGEFLKSASEIIMEYCGGASGPIWGSAFRGAGKAAGDVKEIDLKQLAEIMQAAVKAIQETGERSFGRGAVVGDKTLIDALVPAADSLSASAVKGEALIDAMDKAAKAAVEGAEATKKIAARMGRAGTVGERSIGHPDAGAYGLGVIFTELVKFAK